MRRRKYRVYFALAAAAILGGCSREPVVTHAAVIAPQSEPESAVRRIRSTGTIQAEKAFMIQVPQISGQTQGQGGRLTLVGIAESGARVNIDYTPRAGTGINVDGRLVGEPIAGKGLNDALLRVWLGEKPLDERLKESLLRR